jgi:hypothetical protein
MQETIMSKEASPQTKKNLQAYFLSHDIKYLTDDVVFRNFSTGEVYTGRAEAGAFLHNIYHVAFDAKLEVTQYEVKEESAFMEGFFKGRHTGEFNGIAPTQKDVKAPVAVIYKIRKGLISEAHIYLLASVLMQQLGAGIVSPKHKTTYLVRDIFYLKFGQYREARNLLQEALSLNLLPDSAYARVLSDFTGDAYRLVFEEGFESLDAYEVSLTSSMKTDEWQQWYQRFKPLVERSSREILKQVI